ncbi:MAG: 4Fe-4S dicluster domain-containing protein, partial [Armatimonadetes bacterium]|nr:4Fe-4S dicluster domain-containing protein [Armatimonadota bacterium]
MATTIPQLHLPELYDCVHCGLCLNACPTYRETRMEAESPRGRITLVHAAAEGRAQVTPQWADHLYLCLMCRACETACPSGVQYGRIAERARAMLGPHGSWMSRVAQRFAFTQLLPHPRRLRLLARLLRFAQRTSLLDDVGAFLPARLRDSQSLLPRVPDHFFPDGASVFPARGARRARVGLLAGCAMGTLFAGVQDAVVRVLQRNGIEVVVTPAQTCCGALNFHNGESRAA